MAAQVVRGVFTAVVVAVVADRPEHPVLAGQVEMVL
jgi:hypothetical protein